MGVSKDKKTHPAELQIRLARIISWVLHPFWIAPLAIVLILYLDGVRLAAAIGWAGLCLAFVILPIMAFIIYKLARKQLTDADVSVREQRYGFYIFAVGCVVLCYVILVILGAPAPVRAIFGSGLVTLVAFGITTRLWLKVSIHSGMMGSMTTASAFFSLQLAAVLALLTALVAWSRLTLKRHTPAEIFFGLLIACTFTGLGMATVVK